MAEEDCICAGRVGKPVVRRYKLVLYQVNFAANWIWREVVVVESSKPRFDPRVLLSTGAWKLVWLNMWKNSIRSSRLAVSESLEIGVFLITEKSKSTNPGPTSWFLPLLPITNAQRRGWGDGKAVGV